MKNTLTFEQIKTLFPFINFSEEAEVNWRNYWADETLAGKIPSESLHQSIKRFITIPKMKKIYIQIWTLTTFLPEHCKFPFSFKYDRRGFMGNDSIPQEISTGVVGIIAEVLVVLKGAISESTDGDDNDEIDCYNYYLIEFLERLNPNSPLAHKVFNAISWCNHKGFSDVSVNYYGYRRLLQLFRSKAAYQWKYEAHQIMTKIIEDEIKNLPDEKQMSIHAYEQIVFSLHNNIELQHEIIYREQLTFLYDKTGTLPIRILPKGIETLRFFENAKHSEKKAHERIIGILLEVMAKNRALLEYAGTKDLRELKEIFTKYKMEKESRSLNWIFNYESRTDAQQHFDALERMTNG